DVYALGVVLYELLTGTPPYRASTVAELVRRRGEEEPPLPSALQPDVPPELDGLVLACLAEAPARRPSARDVELTLRGELDPPTRVLTPSALRPTEILPRRRRGRSARLAGAAAALAVLALALGLGLSRGGPARKSPPAQPRIASIRAS